MNTAVPEVNNGRGLNDGEVGYAHNTLARLLHVRFFKSYLPE